MKKSPEAKGNVLLLLSIIEQKAKSSSDDSYSFIAK